MNLPNKKLLSLYLSIFILALFQVSCGSSSTTSSSGGGTSATPSATEVASNTSEQMINAATALLVTVSSSNNVNPAESSSDSGIVGCATICGENYTFTGTASSSGSEISSIEESSTECDFNSDAVDLSGQDTSSISGTVGGTCEYFLSSDNVLSATCDLYSSESDMGSYSGSVIASAVSMSSQETNMTGTYTFSDATTCSAGLRVVSGPSSENLSCLYETTAESLQEAFASDSCDGNSTLTYTQAVAALTEGEATSTQIFCTLKYASCISENTTCFNVSDITTGASACGFEVADD